MFLWIPDQVRDANSFINIPCHGVPDEAGIL